MPRQVCPATLICCLLAGQTQAGPNVWIETPIFNQPPLELKMGRLGPNPDPDVLVMVLTSDRAQNHIHAVSIPPPYDGSGVTNLPIRSGSTLFALGDVCTLGSTVLVPYIFNFNVEVARRDGGVWTISTIPGTTSNSYTTTDCGVSADGVFISAQDFNDAEIEVFRSIDAGQSYTFYGRYSSGIAGPFSGAIRDQLVTDPTGSEAMAVSQLASGPIQLTHFHTNQPSPGDFSNINLLTQPPVPGSFTVVRESAGARLRDAVVFTYNADNTVRTVFVPFGNPAGFQNDALGAIDNNGSLFPFQGGAIGPASPTGDDYNVLWGDYFYIDPAGSASTDPDYPLSGLGGPIARCQSQPVPSSGSSFGRYAGPNPAGSGTSLYTRREPLAVIFDDGFESGDVSAWTCADE